MRYIRNHAEAVVSKSFVKKNPNMIGYNFRMGEIEAAIASIQLKKLESRVLDRQRIAKSVSLGGDWLRTANNSPSQGHGEG